MTDIFAFSSEVFIVAGKYAFKADLIDWRDIYLSSENTIIIESESHL